MNKAAKCYLREVKGLLPCSRREKRRYLAELEVDVVSYLQGCPDASVEDLCHHFGEPKAVAKEFMAQLSPEQLSRKMSVKRKIVIGVISITAILALFVGIMSAIVSQKRISYYEGYYVDIIDVISSTDAPNQEPIEVH